MSGLRIAVIGLEPAARLAKEWLPHTFDTSSASAGKVDLICAYLHEQARSMA